MCTDTELETFNVLKYTCVYLQMIIKMNEKMLEIPFLTFPIVFYSQSYLKMFLFAIVIKFLNFTVFKLNLQSWFKNS